MPSPGLALPGRPAPGLAAFRAPVTRATDPAGLPPAPSSQADTVRRALREARTPKTPRDALRACAERRES
ncbi:hypothetical protein ALMP_53620 [Streptomyces sp. A012304]|nr:hypothetical protein ALMP_53620 [Streptomyces sp. A012304]